MVGDLSASKSLKQLIMTTEFCEGKQSASILLLEVKEYQILEGNQIERFYLQSKIQTLNRQSSILLILTD